MNRHERFFLPFFLPAKIIIKGGNNSGANAKKNSASAVALEKKIGIDFFVCVRKREGKGVGIRSYIGHHALHDAPDNAKQRGRGEEKKEIETSTQEDKRWREQPRREGFLLPSPSFEAILVELSWLEEKKRWTNHQTA